MTAGSTQRYSVHVVAETDDFDGVSRIGMAYRNWSGAVDVLIDDGNAGWWDGQYIPYLVFFRGPRPSQQEAEAAVRQALLVGPVQAGACLEPESSFLPTPTAYVDVPLTDQDSFAEMARHGLEWGWFFPHVTYRWEPGGGVQLLFYRDEHDLPSDEPDLEAVMRMLP